MLETIALIVCVSVGWPALAAWLGRQLVSEAANEAEALEELRAGPGR